MAHKHEQTLNELVDTLNQNDPNRQPVTVIPGSQLTADQQDYYRNLLASAKDGVKPTKLSKLKAMKSLSGRE